MTGIYGDDILRLANSNIEVRKIEILTLKKMNDESRQLRPPPPRGSMRF